MMALLKSFPWMSFVGPATGRRRPVADTTVHLADEAIDGVGLVMDEALPAEAVEDAVVDPGFVHRVRIERVEPNTVETTTPADAGAVREAPLSRGTFVVEDAAIALLRGSALVELRPDTRQVDGRRARS